MPSSHLRMEEATSIIASKTVANGFGRSEVGDDLDDFVLQIDPNEINNEIKANKMVEDLAIDVLKDKDRGNENEIIVDNASSNSDIGEQKKSVPQIEEENQPKSNVAESLGSNQGLNNAPNIKEEDSLKDIKQVELELKVKEEVAQLNESDDKTYDMKLKDRIDGSIAANNSENGPAQGIDKIKKECPDSFDMEVKTEDIPDEESFGINVNVDTEKILNQCDIKKEETDTDNLDVIDKELDSLLNSDSEISNCKPLVMPEPMQVDPPVKDESAEVKISSANSHSSDKIDLDSSEQSGISEPSAVTTTPSPVSPGDLSNSLNNGDVFPKDKPECLFASNKNNTDCKESNEKKCSYITVKKFPIGANSDVSKEEVRSEKRPKRQPDQVASKTMKKVKLDKEDTPKNSNNIKKKKLNTSIDPNSCKKMKPNSVVTNSDTFGLMNGQATMNEMNQIKDKIIKEVANKDKIGAETIEEIKEGRKKLFSNYFEGKEDILVNRCILEELVMAQIIDFMSYKCEIGQLRQKCRLLEGEQIRVNQMVYGLKRQAENAKLIIKKLIDEKVSNKPWTQNVIPLKVTRSVGLQVCTCGSMTVRTKTYDNRKTTKNEKGVNKDIKTVTRSSIQNNESTTRNKNGLLENKENISSNFKKDASQKERNTEDVAVSVTDNDKSTSSSITNRDNIAGKKVAEAPKNGITPNDKNVKKPFSVEHGVSPLVSTKTVAASSSKKPVTENLSKKELAKSGPAENKVDEIIDLTDKEDQPASNRSETSSKPATAAPEKTPAGIQNKVKTTPTNSAAPSNSLVAVNGIKKPPVSNSSKKPVDIPAPAADLVNSYDHLPKYPISPKYPSHVTKPPRPILRIGKNTSGKQGIMLSWSFEGGRNPPDIEEYQLYAYQESKTSEKMKTDTWKKVGDIKALPLPMACFLTQFVEGHKYHFIVRAVDNLKRLGDFSLPGSIILHAAGQSPSAS